MRPRIRTTLNTRYKPPRLRAWAILNKMLTEVNEAKAFLSKKFNGTENVKPGTYAIPTKTSKGKAFMKVVIDENMGMSDFHLFNDEALTDSWYN